MITVKITKNKLKLLLLLKKYFNKGTIFKYIIKLPQCIHSSVFQGEHLDDQEFAKEIFQVF